MVSNARLLLPEPDTPVMTTNLSRGNADVDVLEVVLACASYDDFVFVHQLLLKSELKRTIPDGPPRAHSEREHQYDSRVRSLNAGARVVG